MFFSKIKICDMLGIPIYANSSALILLVMFMLDCGSFSFGLAMGLMLGVSIVLHELGHSLMARRFGYEAREITLSFLGGCASFSSVPRKAVQELLTAIAGPAVSFAIAALCWLMLNFLPIRSMFTAMVLGYTMWINFVLGAFNLLPGFPMDGGRIFRSLVRMFTGRIQVTYVAMVVGRGVAILLGLRGLWAVMNGGQWGLMQIFIAWMIWKEGQREYFQTINEEAWGGRWEFSARVSSPPYGGDDDETEIRRER